MEFYYIFSMTLTYNLQVVELERNIGHLELQIEVHWRVSVTSFT